uniref:Uncharacterized protein n=1 Tax=Rhizophora mucronata TaxID=61149 RepID=A0A2P2J0Z6_RHIMU
MIATRCARIRFVFPGLKLGRKSIMIFMKVVLQTIPGLTRQLLSFDTCYFQIILS